MTRPELVARIAELEQKLRLARNAMYRQRRRAEMWRTRALKKKEKTRR
jgi:transcription elongation GreA/GreB family factor